MKKNLGGRPTKMTKETVDKLEYVFAMGGTDLEACLHADISHQTLYDYQERNPRFVERKNSLKQTPLLKARGTIMQSLGTDVQSAWRYVERKDPELNPKSQLDITTAGDKLEVNSRIEEIAAAVAEQLKEEKT